MKPIIVFALLLVTSGLSFAREKAQGFCTQGNQVVVTPGSSNSTTKIQRSYPGCTVTIYRAGTLTLATIYSDDIGTSKGNPFTASSTGQWFFYANDGAYDIKLSGANISPTFTLGAITLYDDRQVGQFDVLRYGAIGDGSTNSSAAFTAAISAVPAGGTLTIGPGANNPGIYLIADIAITKSVNIKCTSPTVIIKQSGAATSLFAYTSVTGASIDGCTFDTGYSGVSGISAITATTSSNFSFTNNVFQNIGGNAISLTDTFNVHVEGNKFSNIFRSGIIIQQPTNAALNTDYWFKGNLFSSVGLRALGGTGNIQTFGDLNNSLPSISRVWVGENTIITPGTVGIGLDNCDYCKVLNNRITANGVSGEAIAFSGNHNLIQGNIVNGSVAAGILLYALPVATHDSSYNTITDNISFDNAIGIALVFSATNSVIDNEMLMRNKAFNTASGPVQNYGIQTYCDTQIPSAGSCTNFTNIVYSNNTISLNDLFANATGSSSITATGINNTNNYNRDFSDGLYNIAGPITLPTYSGIGSTTYPINARGTLQTGVNLVAGDTSVGGIGFNDLDATGQLDLLAANQNAIIGFYTPGHVTPISITAISAAANTVLTTTVSADTSAGKRIFLFGLTGACAYLMNSPHTIVSTGGGTITIDASGAACNPSYAGGGTYNTVARTGFVDPRGWVPPTIPFASLSSANISFVVSCNDCTINTTPPYTCAGAGTGAWAFRTITGVWKCPF